MSAPPNVTAGIATFLPPMTLYDAHDRPFTAFPVELKGDGGVTWRIVKRFESFAALQRIAGAAYPLNLPMPPAPSGRSDAAAASAGFVQEMRACMQTWVRKLLRDPAIASLDSVRVFLSTSDGGREPPTAEQSALTMDDGDADEMEVASGASACSGASGSGSSGAASSSASASSSAAGGAEDPTAHSVVRLEDFHLLKVIGKGSFGKVMLVRKIDTGDVFAMKVLSKDHVVKRNQVEHTKTERNVLEYIRHPFIVSLRYAFQTKNKLYFVLDYCAGGELFFHLGKMGKFSEPLAKFYVAEIVLAIEYLVRLKHFNCRFEYFIFIPVASCLFLRLSRSPLSAQSRNRLSRPQARKRLARRRGIDDCE